MSQTQEYIKKILNGRTFDCVMDAATAVNLRRTTFRHTIKRAVERFGLNVSIDEKGWTYTWEKN